MKTLISLSLLFFLLSCTTQKSDPNFSKPIKIVRFMGVDSYSSNINPQIFWSQSQEHMFLFMEKADFLSEIENYKETDKSNLQEYIYAFVTAKKDTLYSDYDLRSWILIRNNKQKYYLDEQGKTSEFLKRTFPFFRDCSYTPN
ncbi:hypothetical protein [Chryseobacterium sp. 2987]|uniref:hypothetical protein n=1 Tax=Chryseobacterium sp. 2987 TaxID=2817767 RepID=UPI0028638D63|nr:hypothetical protein [Chryseobacterium sp. 2987]MDR6919555.1 hypothetical protein [Chryseobacterium sp. 2987]